MGLTGPLPDHILRKMTPEQRKPLGKAGMTHEEAESKAEAGKELELQGEIAAYLRMKEIVYAKPDPRKKSAFPEGWPDFTFCYRGLFCGVEVKTAVGRLSEAQVKMHEQMRAEPNGAIVIVARSLEEVKKLLHRIDECHPGAPAPLA